MTKRRHFILDTPHHPAIIATPGMRQKGHAERRNRVSPAPDSVAFRAWHETGHGRTHKRPQGEPHRGPGATPLTQGEKPGEQRRRRVQRDQRPGQLRQKEAPRHPLTLGTRPTAARTCRRLLRRRRIIRRTRLPGTHRPTRHTGRNHRHPHDPGPQPAAARDARGNHVEPCPSARSRRISSTK